MEKEKRLLSGWIRMWIVVSTILGLIPFSILYKENEYHKVNINVPYENANTVDK